MLHANKYIPTSFIQKSLLAVGSGMLAIANPHRGDMVAIAGSNYFTS